MAVQAKKKVVEVIPTKAYEQVNGETIVKKKKERSDDIYIVRNKNGINVEKLSRILKRNDIKKSEAYQSGYLQGTAPAYESYIK